MNRFTATTLLMLASALWPAPSYSDDKMPQKICSIEGISEYELQNGMRVLLFPDVSQPKVTVNLTIFVGSRHEGYGEAGMAHLLEHMVFKGTPDHPEIPKALKDRGAEFNGTTWLDRTNYYETLAASDENLEFAIRMEADRMVNSFIRKEDLDSEMTVVRNEFERGENSPFRIMMQRMLSGAFEWHNYGKSTIGNRADIERVPIDNLKAFYKRFYQPDNAMLVVAGKFDPQQALQLAQEHFGSLPLPDRELNNTYTEEPPQDGDRLITLRRVGEVPMAGLVYHIPAGPHPEFVALDVLATIMTDNPSGRLYEALVRKRQAAAVFGFTFALHDPGVVLFGAQAAQGIDAIDLLQGMTDVTEGATDFTEEEVERAKQKLLKERELAIAESQKIAIELSEWAAQGDWRLFFLYRDRLEKVTAADVQAVATKYLIRNNRTAGLFEPTAGPERATIPSMPDVAEMIGDYQGREQIAMGEEFDTAPIAIESRITRTRLDSGLKVALLPKKTRGATVQMRLALRYGNLESLQGAAVAAEFVGQMLVRGTNSLTRQQISDAFNKYRVEQQFSSTPGSVVVTIKTLRENVGPVLSLLQEILRNPVFPEEELELMREAQLATLEQQLTDPTRRAVNAARRKVSDYASADPRYQPTIEEKIERVKAVTVDDLRTIYKSLTGQNGELSIVGDFDPTAAMAALNEITAGWSSDVAFEHVPQISVNNKRGSLEQIQIPDKAQATYFATFTLPMRNDHPDYPALALGNFILGSSGLSSRLGDRVRQQDGLSYSVGSSFQASSVDDRSSFYIFAIFNPANGEKLKTAVREEIDRLLNDGITEKELTDQKAGLLQQIELQRTRDDSLASLMGTHLRTDRTMQFTLDFQNKLNSLTVDDVNTALRKHIRPERLHIVMAGDFSEQPEASPQETTSLVYPPTKTVDQTDDFHGTKVNDPYRWLEDDVRESKAVADWVAAQNKVAFGYLKAIPGRDQIEERITELWNYEKISAPAKEGGRYYFFRNDGLQNQNVLYVQETLLDEPRVLIDPNTWSDDGTVALSGTECSDDGRYAAYGIQDGGSDWRTWKVMEIASGRILEDELKWIKFSSIAWTPDSKGFFYSRYDEPKEGAEFQSLNLNQKVFYHTVGTAQEADQLIYERPDHPEWGFGADVSEDGRYLILTVWKGTDDRYRVVIKDLTQDNAKPFELIDNFDYEYSFIGNNKSLLYFQTNLGAPLRRIIGIDLTAPESENWVEVVPETEHTLTSASIVGDMIIGRYLKDARTQVRLHSMDGRFVREVEFPGIGAASGFSGKRSHDETFYSFSSFATPPSTYRYDIKTGESTLLRQAKVRFDPADYETTQVFYNSKDGTRVPMFICHRKGLELDGTNPTLLYGYGGFNISLTPRFSVSRLAWMEMGGVYAVPNLRGGGEYGEPWHKAGTKLNKQNVFDDFISAAEWLIDNKYTSSEKLAIMGGSNGGLLVGACMTQRPDLYAACLPAVGVMDMLRFHKFTAGRFWVDDYGSADNPEEFKALYAYSPYHNLKPGTAYPATLVTTADTDDRVVPGHSFKFAARLQVCQKGSQPTLIRIETRAGHGSGKPTAKIIEEVADEWAFLAKNLKMNLVE